MKLRQSITWQRGQRLVWSCLALGLLAACASEPFAPASMDDFHKLSSYQSRTVDDVTVSVAILPNEQAERHFGVDLGANGLQALWVQVRNASNSRYWFVRNIVDRDLYSADEAAHLMQEEVADGEVGKLQQYLRDESIRVAMEPGYVTQGYVYLPYVEGGRYVEVRLTQDAYDAEHPVSHDGSVGVPRVGALRELRFGFGVTLPDGDFDYERLGDIIQQHARSRHDLDLDGLRRAIGELPCCVRNEDGDADGDPLNVVLVGEASDLMYALSRCGWSFTHRITAGSVRRMISAALEGEGYAVAPVSNLYVFDRKQDIALQRARANIAQRNHMRLWLAPFTLEGRSVWVGQISRDIGVKLTIHSPSLTTHIIDPEVDLTREYLLHSLLAEGFVTKFGFAAGSAVASIDKPALNLAGDPYFSDGLRLVLIMSKNPVPYSEVHNLRWEQATSPVAEGQSEAANRNVQPISLPDR